MKRLVFLLLLVPSLLLSQNVKYAHYVVDTLASPTLQGRGYCTQGNNYAAYFIRMQLKDFNVKPLVPNYFQKFAVAKNCITDSIKLSVDNKSLVLGKDYIIKGNAPSLHGTFDLLRVKNPKKWKKLKRKDVSDKFVAVDWSQLTTDELKRVYTYNLIGAKGIILLKNSFPYYPAVSRAGFVTIEMKPSALPDKAQKISISLNTQMKTQLKTQNVLGYIPGEVDTFIVFTAHYDHLGRLGQIYFPGANDNASGVAMLLDIAHNLSQRKCKPHYSIAFMFFTGEELGLLGSLYYVQHPVFDLNKIKLLVNLDMVGSGDEGITVVNAKNNQNFYNKLVSVNEVKQYLPSIKARGQAMNSDHYYFAEKGVPAVFIYTRGKYKEYHNIYDRADKVPLTKFEDLERLLLETVFNL